MDEVHRPRVICTVPKKFFWNTLRCSSVKMKMAVSFYLLRISSLCNKDHSDHKQEQVQVENVQTVHSKASQFDLMTFLTFTDFLTFLVMSFVFSCL